MESETQALILQIDAPSDARLGEPVPLKLTLKNAVAHPVEVALAGRPPHDFVIAGSDGTEVWRWTHGQAVQQILGLVVLNPGQEVELTVEWPQQDSEGKPVPAGVYQVWGLLHLEPPTRLATQPKPLHLSP